MINLDLTRLVNSERAWAFIGSGVSVNAGSPTWEGLLDRCAEILASTGNELPHDKEAEIARLRKKGDLPAAFQVLAKFYQKSNLDAALETVFEALKRPGEIHEIIARWPFTAVVTTNYELLQEIALQRYPGGWVSVGNSAEETKKISKDTKQVVWHPHGGVNLGDKNDRYVITASDYDETYPSSSPVCETLSSLMRMCRMVFIGFGFKDPDLQNLLRRITRISTPGYPSFAFLHSSSAEDRARLKKEYNVEVIPYHVRNGDHSDLLQVLGAHGPFVITRDIQYGSRSLEDVGYDPCVTSLLVQNQIQQKTLTTTREAAEVITRASILSALDSHDQLSFAEIETDIDKRCGSRASKLVPQAIEELESKNLVTKSGDLVSLSAQGKELVSSGATAAALQKDQFLASLRSRVGNGGDSERTERIARIAGDFLEHICRDRGLGVAQNLVGTTPAYQQYRAVALIQELPRWFEKCSNREESVVLVQVVNQLLQMPGDTEKVYLGCLTQAYFGQHLAGADLESAPLRREALDQTLFVCDSSFLIPLLAKDSPGHESAKILLDLLSATDCKTITTDLLMLETSEHAEYALRLVKRYGESSCEVLDEARSGANAFLSGYISGGGKASGQSFVSHLSSLVGGGTGNNLNARVKHRLENIGVSMFSVDEWEGSSQKFYDDIEDVKQRIESRRKTLATFKHERQVQAEAEVAILVSKIRSGEVKYPKHPSDNAFFLSHSRVIDNIESLPDSRLSMSPESLFQWLSSLQKMSNERASALFDLLLRDLAETGYNLVPREQIVKSFSGLIEASKSKLKKVFQDHKEMIIDLYGQDSQAAFNDMDVLDIPRATEAITLLALEDVKKRLEKEQELRQVAESRLSQLEKHQAVDLGRKEKALRKRREAESRSRTKKERQRRMRNRPKRDK